MSTLLFSQPTNKFKSKLIDRKYKNKHRNRQHRDVRCSNKCIDFEYNKTHYEKDFRYIEKPDIIDNTVTPIWQCPLCTYINIERLSFCSICNQPLNYNFYNTNIQSNKPIPISIKTFNHKKIKRKSRKQFRKHNKNSFENYWNSISKYKNEYAKAAVQNKTKIIQTKLKQTQIYKIPETISKSRKNSNKSKYQKNIKLNLTLRFKTVQNSSEYTLAVKRYNKQHPENQINIKDYALLDCCVTIQNIITNSIIKSIHFKPDIDNFCFPIISSASNILSKNDLPLINQTQLFLKGLGGYDRKRGIPIVQYVKMNNSEIRLIASECIKHSAENIQFEELKLVGNGTPILFNKYELLKLLFEYIPQMDILSNILISFIGYTFFYYIRMESYGVSNGYELEPNELDNKKLCLEKLINRQIEFVAAYVPKYYKINWNDKYLRYPKEWHREGHRTRGYGKNKWESVYAKRKNVEKDDNSKVIYHCPFCRWFEKNKIEVNRWGYSRYWYPRRGHDCEEYIPLYKKCPRKTKSRKYWRNWY
eukprot:78151_1